MMTVKTKTFNRNPNENDVCFKFDVNLVKITRIAEKVLIFRERVFCTRVLLSLYDNTVHYLLHGRET